jgi:quercetin dioxygenase-like cupin family protein
MKNKKGSREGMNMFKTSQEAKPVEMMEGITRRTLTFGERMLLVEFTIRKGAVFPEHSHPYEQTGYLCKGAGRLWIGEEAFDLSPGSSWSIPADVSHKAEFSENSLALDIFSPVREDYLDT